MKKLMIGLMAYNICDHCDQRHLLPGQYIACKGWIDYKKD